MVHPDEKTLRDYADRRLDAAEMTRVILHLEACPECRGAVAELSGYGEAQDDSESAEYSILDYGDELDFHLSFDEQLRPYADGVADEATREIVESHTAVCKPCSLQVTELRNLVAELAVPLPAKTSFLSKLAVFLTPRMRYAAAFGAALIVVAGIVFAVFRNPPADDLAEIVTPPVESPPPSVSPTNEKTPTGSPTPSVTPTVSPTVKTEEDPLARYEKELAAVSPAMRQTIEDALRTGRDPRSRALELLGSAPKLRGNAESSASASPNREVVTETNPLLRWADSPQTRWKVEIYDDGGNVIAASENISGNTWRPTKSLPRGRVYRWQATPDATSNSTTKPIAGSFYVLDALTLNDLDRLKTAPPELRRLARIAAGLKP